MLAAAAGPQHRVEVHMHYESVFDMYAIAPPEGDWAYVVDDHTVTFGPGWWPLYRNGKPSAVRVAPGSEYLSWRNENVAIYPGQDATANAKLHLFVRKQGMGAITVLTWIHLDLRACGYQLNLGLPRYLHEQAAGKAARLLDLLLAARSARRRGATHPITAYDLWIARQQAK